MSVEEIGNTYLIQDLKQEGFWFQAILPIEESIDLYLQLTEHLV